MDIHDKGVRTQIENIEAATGKPLASLRAEIEGWGELRYAERRERIASSYGLGTGHADTLGAVLDQIRIEETRKATGATWKEEAEGWFVGGKAKFLPLFRDLVAAVETWPGVEFAPKKGYLSLRTCKQFATLGPATSTRLEVGLNGRHFVAGERLQALPPGQICHFQVRLAEGDAADTQLLEWIRAAYETSAA